MKFEKKSDRDFQKDFINIISLSKKDNPYKFAFARFLLEYSRENSENHIEFKTIAKYFFRYFWPQVCKSKIKHNAYGDKKPVDVVDIIEKEFGKSYHPEKFSKILEIETEKIEKCYKEIEKRCFEIVTWAFQNIKEGNKIKDVSPEFFEYKIKKKKRRKDHGGYRIWIEREYGINLNPHAMDFFVRYNIPLLKSTTLEWAKFLEKLNPAFPALIQKTEGEIVQRTPLPKYRKELIEFGFKNCFYCNNPLNPGRETAVEHVIPFVYIAEDEMWNFVLACNKCNSRKLGSLPPNKFVNDLIERNREYGEKMPLLKKSLMKLEKDFKKTIDDHITNAKSHGFTVLKNDFFIEK